MKHRRVVVSRHGGPDVLQVAEEGLTGPAAGEVWVKVLGAGVSAFDLVYRRSGRLPSVPSCPDVGRFAEAHHDWYRETLSESSVCWRRANSGRWWRTAPR